MDIQKIFVKRKTFIALVIFHAVFFAFTFLMYLTQYLLYNDSMAEGVARVYAMSLFVPNIIGMALVYFFYIYWLARNIFSLGKIGKFKLHISYNIFFLSGLSLEFFQIRSPIFSDSFFIVAELAALFLAGVIIREHKKKEKVSVRPLARKRKIIV